MLRLSSHDFLLCEPEGFDNLWSGDGMLDFIDQFTAKQKGDGGSSFALNEDLVDTHKFHWSDVIAGLFQDFTNHRVGHVFPLFHMSGGLIDNRLMVGWERLRSLSDHQEFSIALDKSRDDQLAQKAFHIICSTRQAAYFW